MMQVPYISPERIERDAEALLAEFARGRQVVITPPIAIEDVLEKHLKLGIEFDDLHKRTGIRRRGLGLYADIIGAMVFQERRIVIDPSLDPVVDPSQEGRYRFTLAHEGGGHWRLHRDLFLGSGEASIVCRSNQPYNRAEWQANFYASCLLMPRSLIFATWRQIAGSDAVCRRLAATDASPSCAAAADQAAWEMAERFLVSPAAMLIRLEKLALLPPERPRQEVLARAA
jgi:hypothetical protein